jgi:hypothetical protein
MLCPHCISSRHIKQYTGESMTYYWAVRVVCRKCEKSWFICAECYSNNVKGQRPHLLDTRQLYDHNRYMHSTKNLLNDDTADFEGMHVLLIDDCNSGTETALLEKHIFRNSCSETFFSKEIVKSGSRLHHLVMYANSQQPATTNVASWREVRFHFLYANMACKLSRGDRADLGQLIGLAFEMDSNEMVTSIPTTGVRIRSKYIEGKHALLQNLPRPLVTCYDGHAYVSVVDCVADLLAHGVPISCITDANEVNDVTNVTHIVDSRRAKKIYKNALDANGTDKDLLVLSIICWSDGFEPLSSSKG